MKGKITVHLPRFILAILTLASSLSCKDKKITEKDTVNNLMQIEGSITNFNEGKIQLTEIAAINTEENINTILAETTIKNGKFSFKNIKVTANRAMNLMFGDSLRTILFLEPGTLELEIFPKDTIFTELHYGTQVRSAATGTKNNTAFSNYKTLRQNLENMPKYVILRSFDKNLFSDEPDFDAMNNTFSKNGKLLDERDSLVFELKEKMIRNHQDKMLAPYLLVHEDFGLGEDFEGYEVIQFFKNLNTDLKGNAYYDQVAEYVAASKNTVKGAIAPDFMLKNEKGKHIILSDLDKEYVLVDFWAYWCVPCIASFPHLEEVRKKYKSRGFEILGVSADPNHEKWIDALEKYEPSWLQVIDNDDKTVSKDYNIVELPTSFLLDKDGKIIAKNPDEEQLDELLNGLLNKN